MEEAHSATPELANIITLLNKLFGEYPAVKFAHHFENAIFSGVAIIFLAILARIATKNKTLIPGGLQNFVELCVEWLDDLVCGVLGHRGRDYTPFLGTLFIYILTLNMSGLVPGLKSPSSSLNTTAGLAIIVFFYVQYTGIKRLGIIGYFDHLLGQPRDIMGIIFIPLMLPLHVVEEFIKPLSLSLRLFGNILGEDSLIAVFVGLGIVALSFIKSPVGIPFQIPFMLLSIIAGSIQALVFTLLSTIYISLMLPHEEH